MTDPDTRRLFRVLQAVALDERDFVGISLEPRQGNEAILRLKLSDEGRTKKQKLTDENDGGQIAVVLDGQVLEVPWINKGDSSDVLFLSKALGRSFTDEEVRALVKAILSSHGHELPDRDAIEKTVRSLIDGLDEYRKIQPGDVLALSIAGLDPAPTQVNVRVSAKGRIPLPRLYGRAPGGVVIVAERHLADVEREIAQSYADTGLAQSHGACPFLQGQSSGLGSREVPCDPTGHQPGASLKSPETSAPADPANAVLRMLQSATSTYSATRPAAMQSSGWTPETSS